MTRALVARMDSLGDVLLAGPVVRAVAAGSASVTFLASPTGAPAAALLPGVDEVLTGRAGWIEAGAPTVTRAGIGELVEAIAARCVDRAVILTSFHQSPLPLALVLRMAGVADIGAVSVDYPGSLLDVRHHVPDDVHEVERSLSLGAAMGYGLPAGDDGALAIRLPADACLPPDVGAELTTCGPYVVVHPGASVPARAWEPARHRELVRRLSAAGTTVVVTGGCHERALTAAVAGRGGLDLGGRLDLTELAVVLRGAEVAVVANTGPAHLSAAVGTPVVSLFAPTVPAQRWRPWSVPLVLLGDQTIACAGCRARRCPVQGHPCVDTVPVAGVVDAVDRLRSEPAGRHPAGRDAAGRQGLRGGVG